MEFIVPGTIAISRASMQVLFAKTVLRANTLACYPNGGETPAFTGLGFMYTRGVLVGKTLKPRATAPPGQRQGPRN